MAYDIDHPSPAATSFARWLQDKKNVPVTAREVYATNVASQEWQGWEAERKKAGLPLVNRTQSFDDPSEPAKSFAAFLAGKGIQVDPTHIQLTWNSHSEWQRSPERHAERGKEQVKAANEQTTDAGYFILNQREVRDDDDGYNDVEGQRYHWTSQSSGAWKRLSVSPGARFVYYRPGTASDGTAQSYFGVGAIGQVSEQAPGDFVATIADYVRFERPVPSPEGPSVNHQTSIQPIAKGDFDKLVRLGGTPARPGQKVWIFQANPKRYDLLDFLARPSTQPGIVDEWALRQHAKDVSDGDTVLLWTAGDQAGIYATGTVVGESFMRPRQNWEPEDAPPESLTIHFRLDRILDHPVLRRDLMNHPVLRDLLIIRQPTGTNFPVTEQQWEALRPLIESPSDTQMTPLPPPQRFHPSDDLEWLLRETLWSRAEVEDVLDTIRTRRPQIILAGPPGTGKTWVAERIGRFLTGGQPDAVHVVQFHPSYAYEDFVEGLRPVARDGQVAFEVVPGALVKVADHARRVDHPVVLVIDEMNRANLPSVFGELLYLLEYRDKEIRLLHRDRFSLPPNLYVIGTMNTADRSIRSVDTALRRRFDIFECPPRPDILDAYYRSGGNNSEVFGLAEGLAETERYVDPTPRPSPHRRPQLLHGKTLQPQRPSPHVASPDPATDR